MPQSTLGRHASVHTRTTCLSPLITQDHIPGQYLLTTTSLYSPKSLVVGAHHTLCSALSTTCLHISCSSAILSHSLLLTPPFSWSLFTLSLLTVIFVFSTHHPLPCSLSLAIVSSRFTLKYSLDPTVLNLSSRLPVNASVPNPCYTSRYHTYPPELSPLAFLQLFIPHCGNIISTIILSW